MGMFIAIQVLVVVMPSAEPAEANVGLVGQNGTCPLSKAVCRGAPADRSSVRSAEKIFTVVFQLPG